MKSETDVRQALADHERTWLEMQKDTEKLRTTAAQQHHTPEWIRGYMNGVIDAYDTVLEEK